jgi:hypothetical protein
LAKTQTDMRPNASIIRRLLDGVGRDAIHRSLDTARAKAENDRERRQIAKLAAAIDYWEQAADMFDRTGEANRLAKSDPAAALNILNPLLDQQWPRFQQAMRWSKAPGWISITVPSQWQSAGDAAASLRSQLLAPASATDGK